MKVHIKHLWLFVGLVSVTVFVGVQTLAATNTSLPAFALGAVIDTALILEPVEVDVLDPVPTSAVFTGDIMLARHVEQVIGQYGPQYIFADVEQFATSSAWVGNFEGAVAPVHNPTPDGGMSFSVASSSVAALQSLPVTHLSLANNHSYDQGSSGFTLTETVLRDNAAEPFGDQVVATSSLSYQELNGGVVALLGVYALGVYPDIERLAALLEIAKEQSDVQVVYIHWGEEYQPTHSTLQRSLAEELSALGVHAIIGHHPHVVQDIEQVGDTLVFYSLGNFVFDQYFSDEVEDGMLVEVSFENDAVEYRLHGVSSQGSRSRPRLLPAYDQDRFLSHLAKKSDSALREAINAGVITQYIQ